MRQLILYIHHNPQKHNFSDDFRNYPYSSYQHTLSLTDNLLHKDEVLDIFDSRENFTNCHNFEPDDDFLKNLITGD